MSFDYDDDAFDFAPSRLQSLWLSPLACVLIAGMLLWWGAEGIVAGLRGILDGRGMR
jgi:hypothetical protein